MGKTRDLFKKIRDTKGTFHAKMGSIKDRNGMDLEIIILSEVRKRKTNTIWYHLYQRYQRNISCKDGLNKG